jgi:hypothetical protein
MAAPYSDSRIDYLLDLYCWWCGAQRQHITNHPVRPCWSCGEEFGLTNRPVDRTEPLRELRAGSAGFQQTLFPEGA